MPIGDLAQTRVLRLMLETEVAAGTELSIPPYNDITGFRYINVVVRYTHEDPSQPPMDLGVEFGFDEKGLLTTRNYANLEENIPSPQSLTQFQVAGPESDGTPNKVVSYVVRVPVMGPFVEVFIKNNASVNRKVTVWGYLLA